MRLIEDAHPAGVALAGFGYDPAGRLVEVIDTAGIPLVYEYDDADRITAWIDRGGYRYGYRYDADGRIARVGGEDGTLAEGRVTFTLDSGHASSATIHLTEENGQWRVENNALFP